MLLSTSEGKELGVQHHADTHKHCNQPISVSPQCVRKARGQGCGAMAMARGAVMAMVMFVKNAPRDQGMLSTVASSENDTIVGHVEKARVTARVRARVMAMLKPASPKSSSHGVALGN